MLYMFQLAEAVMAQWHLHRQVMQLGAFGARSPSMCLHWASVVMSRLFRDGNSQSEFWKAAGSQRSSLETTSSC